MTIAVFDSGLGGLSVLSEARRALPRENFLYYADTRHVPYGTKPKEQVRGFILDAVHSIMRERGRVRALVIACNTATSIAANELRAAYDIPIVGMEPAVKPAVEMNRASGRRVLVVATPLTLQESKYHDLVRKVDDMAIVDSLPLPELVGYCEKLLFDGEEIEAYFRRKLADFPLSEYGTIVLGCTHFPFYRSVLRRLLPAHMSIVDGGAGTVKRLRTVLGADAEPVGKGESSIRFVSSGGDADYERKMTAALRYFDEMSRQTLP